MKTNKYLAFLNLILISKNCYSMDNPSDLSGIDDDVNSYMRALRIQNTTTTTPKDLKEQIHNNHFYWSNEESQQLAEIKNKIYQETKKTQHQIKKIWNKTKITYQDDTSSNIK